MTNPTTSAKMRKERIEHLLSELEYEIMRGVMEREIEPDLHFSKIFPCAGRGDGLAALEVHLYPTRGYHPNTQRREGPKLRVVDGGAND